jgi:hypothetical protein
LEKNYCLDEWFGHMVIDRAHLEAIIFAEYPKYTFENFKKQYTFSDIIFKLCKKIDSSPGKYINAHQQLRCRFYLVKKHILSLKEDDKRKRNKLYKADKKFENYSTDINLEEGPLNKNNATKLFEYLVKIILLEPKNAEIIFKDFKKNGNISLFGLTFNFDKLIKHLDLSTINMSALDVKRFKKFALKHSAIFPKTNTIFNSSAEIAMCYWTSNDSYQDPQNILRGIYQSKEIEINYIAAMVVFIGISNHVINKMDSENIILTRKEIPYHGNKIEKIEGLSVQRNFGLKSYTSRKNIPAFNKAKYKIIKYTKNHHAKSIAKYSSKFSEQEYIDNSSYEMIYLESKSEDKTTLVTRTVNGPTVEQMFIEDRADCFYEDDTLNKNNHHVIMLNSFKQPLPAQYAHLIDENKSYNFIFDLKSRRVFCTKNGRNYVEIVEKIDTSELYSNPIKLKDCLEEETGNCTTKIFFAPNLKNYILGMETYHNKRTSLNVEKFYKESKFANSRKKLSEIMKMDVNIDKLASAKDFIELINQEKDENFAILLFDKFLENNFPLLEENERISILHYSINKFFDLIAKDDYFSIKITQNILKAIIPTDKTSPITYKNGSLRFKKMFLKKLYFLTSVTPSALKFETIIYLVKNKNFTSACEYLFDSNNIEFINIFKKINQENLEEEVGAFIKLVMMYKKLDQSQKHIEKILPIIKFKKAFVERKLLNTLKIKQFIAEDNDVSFTTKMNHISKYFSLNKTYRYMMSGFLTISISIIIINCKQIPASQDISLGFLSLAVLIFFAAFVQSIEISRRAALSNQNKQSKISLVSLTLSLYTIIFGLVLSGIKIACSPHGLSTSIIMPLFISAFLTIFAHFVYYHDTPFKNLAQEKSVNLGISA